MMKKYQNNHLGEARHHDSIYILKSQASKFGSYKNKTN